MHFLINKDSNSISKIPEIDFSDAGFKERYHIQEWIAGCPECLDDPSDLMFVSKEFDKFENSKRRADLLALDKDGNLVIIENKRDDSGREVIAQALTYEAFLSKTSFSQLVKMLASLEMIPETEAQKKILDFLETDEMEVGNIFNKSRRIILVSHRFDPEIYTLTKYLTEEYEMNIRLVSATPYKDNSIDFVQVFPPKTTEEVKVLDNFETASNSKSEDSPAQNLYREFWTKAIAETKLGSKSTHKGYINLGRNNGSLVYSKKTGFRLECYIDWAEKEGNKAIFDSMLASRDKIEAAFGQPLVWDRLDEKNSCRIYYTVSNFDLTDRSAWKPAFDKLVSVYQKFKDTVIATASETAKSL